MISYVIIALLILVTIANFALIQRTNKRRQQWRHEMDELAARRNAQGPTHVLTFDHKLTQEEADRVREEWTRKHGKPA